MRLIIPLKALPDPTSQICGIKFDESVTGTYQYYICVDGNQTPGTVQFAIKAGPNNYYYEVPGPTDCEDNCCSPAAT